MLGRTTGAMLVGVDAHPVQVEVDLAGGLPVIAAVGLPGSAVREGIDRVRSALRNTGLSLPNRKIIVNLAPADLRKQGAALDLPIALALLRADDKLPRDCDTALVAGELGLDGRLRPLHGALSMAVLARQLGKTHLLVPAANAAEAAIVEEIRVIGLRTLADALAWGHGGEDSFVASAVELEPPEASPQVPDLRDVRGQAAGRRALEVAASGGHHLLLSGPPGSGKTMLARRLPGILPPMVRGEAIEVTRVWSAAGRTRGAVRERPFRAPHHGISFAGLTGGGLRIRPGEITLATHGVLYLDELTEFRREALEALRQPLEEGTITIVRLHATATMPAAFTLVASMNPCPCGYVGSPGARCRCTPSEVRRYAARLSGPLLDRFDLFVEIPPAPLESIGGRTRAEGSEDVRQRVVESRSRQAARFGSDGPSCNARMSSSELDVYARLDRRSRSLLLTASRRLGLSARGFDRVRRVARTLADLAGAAEIQEPHVAEALRYRRSGAATCEADDPVLGEPSGRRRR